MKGLHPAPNRVSRPGAPVQGLTFNATFEDALTETLGAVLTFSRASVATHPDTGVQVLTGEARFTSGRRGRAIFLEEATTNVFLNSTGVAAATQAVTLTTANGGKWTCSVKGAGTVTSSAGTATASGYGAATAGNPRTIAVTVGGTVTFTVTGADSTTSVQVENKAFPTTHVPAAGTSASRVRELLQVNPAGKINLAGSTICAWLFIGSNSPWLDSVSSCAIFDHSSSGTDNTNRFHITKVGANLTGAVFTSGGVSSGITFANPLTSGWHHIALTWNGSTVTVWVDGVSHSSAGTSAPSAVGTVLKIGGRYADDGTNIVNAVIDCFRIYSRVLTAPEMARLYRSKS